tara:strand:- start:302 stop:703 length:402 start_codon:yes stop_codon:yes gene_type:complete
MKKYNVGDFYFKHKLNTRFRDIDAFKHVNNAVFLTYFEDARKTFFERWNINLEEKSLIVASIKIDYHKQLRHPSSLMVGQKISRLGTTSFDVLSVLFCDDNQISTAITTIVCYDFLQQSIVSLFEEIKKDYNI